LKELAEVMLPSAWPQFRSSA